jgi:hypothetical protein
MLIRLAHFLNEFALLPSSKKYWTNVLPVSQPILVQYCCQCWAYVKIKHLPNIGAMLAIIIWSILQFVLAKCKRGKKLQYWLHIRQHIG